MAESPVIQFKVLFVDDDPSFLQMLRDVFGSASDGAWEIHTATSGGDALQRLRSTRMDLAVIDVFMPGMDGMQLLGVLSNEFPSLPKVLLTGMPDGNTRSAALEGGAALFLEKPASAAGYASVFATLNELLRWHRRFGSRGSLRRLSLLDLVKLECKSGNSRLFEVFAGDMRGEIYIKEGVIIHAIMPDRRGQSAFTYLTTTPGAVFYLRQYVEPIERSVDRQWEFLVMESAHVIAQRAEVPPAPAPTAAGESSAVAAAVAPEPATTPARLAAPQAPPEPEPARTSPAAAPFPAPAARARVLRPGSPEPTTLEMRGEEDLKLAEAPDALPVETILDPGGFKVEELLLCADSREVLHASNGVDAQKRAQLAEVLAQKSRGFATQLPLGDVERVELCSAASRMVLRYEAKHFLLVRTNTKVVQPGGNPAATETAAEWLARTPVMRGLLAANVLTTDGVLHHRSFVPDFPEDVTRVIAREAARLPELALKYAFPAWLVRILYGHSQFYVFRRQDGALLMVFLLRSGGDRMALEKFYGEFASVRHA